MNMKALFLMLMVLVAAVLCQSNETIPTVTLPISATLDANVPRTTLSVTPVGQSTVSIIVSEITFTSTLRDAAGRASSLGEFTPVGNGEYKASFSGDLAPGELTVKIEVVTAEKTVEGYVVPANSLMYTFTVANLGAVAENIPLSFDMSLPSSKLASNAINQGSLSDGRIFVTVDDEGIRTTFAQEPSWGTGNTVLTNAIIGSSDDAEGVRLTSSFIIPTATSGGEYFMTMSFSDGPADPTADDDDDDDDETRGLAVLGSVLGAFGLGVSILGALLCALVVLIIVITFVVIIVGFVVFIVLAIVSIAGAFFGKGPFAGIVGKDESFAGQNSAVYHDQDESLEDDDSEDDDSSSESESETESDL